MTSVKTVSEMLESSALAFATSEEQAASGASEVLDIIPGQPHALLLLMNALRLMNADSGARDLLEWMAQEYPNLASIRYELGLLLARLGMPNEAEKHLSHAVMLEPNHPSAWRSLGHQRARIGDQEGARKAFARHTMLSLNELKLLEESVENVADENQAENIFRQALEISPTDVTAARLLGEFMLRKGRLREAKTELKRALDLAPACEVTRYLYIITLTQLMDWTAANEQIQVLLRENPDDPQLESLLIQNLAMRGERDAALFMLEKVRPKELNNQVIWYNYALGARSLGIDTALVIEAYRKCVELDPGYGTGWWGLADLKTYRFSPGEIDIMRAQLNRDDISYGMRCQLEFSLGSALEKEAKFEESFDHYRKGNELRRPYISYSADAMHRDLERAKAFFTAKFFADRQSAGCVAPDPIFIVGMPRAGSTLVEQILASHSQVEGTMELPDLGDIVAELVRQHPEEGFPSLLGTLSAPELRGLGEEYINRTRYQRKLGRPFFTDKAGGNFAYIGLIQIILPNAKIIDARRHPLACGFSCYKQAFAPGALHFTYSQEEIGRYYADYVETMDHYDSVLPGRVHRVFHERLIQEPEKQIRELLSYCGLPFEENCVRFYETKRSIRTSSSEQVRQPIRKKAIEDWQHYETWLGPMKSALGEALTCYPNR